MMIRGELGRLNTPKADVVFLAGVGGVGKTSVINILKKLEPDIQVMPSITRTVYAKMGLTEEKQAMALTAEQRQEFQSLIFKTYLEETAKFITENRGKGPVVIDRSPFDHVSYKTYILPEMSVEEHVSLVIEAQNFMQRFGEESLTLLFPFPVPWAWNSTNSDGMRYAPAGKNLAWHGLLAMLVETRSHSRYEYLMSTTPMGRAYEVLSYIVD